MALSKRLPDSGSCSIVGCIIAHRHTSPSMMYAFIWVCYRFIALTTITVTPAHYPTRLPCSPLKLDYNSCSSAYNDNGTNVTALMV